MTEVPASELAQLARIWGRGKKALKALYEEGAMDKLGIHTYQKVDTKDPAIIELSETCNIDGMIKFIQTDATPKTARATYFSAVFCLGSEILEREEK